MAMFVDVFVLIIQQTHAEDCTELEKCARERAREQT